MILLFFFACPGLLLQKKMKKMLVGTRKTKKNADEEMKELEEKKITMNGARANRLDEAHEANWIAPERFALFTRRLESGARTGNT